MTVTNFAMCVTFIILLLVVMMVSTKVPLSSRSFFTKICIFFSLVVAAVGIAAVWVFAFIN